VNLPVKNVEEIKIFIKNFQVNRVVSPEPNFASQLKVYAAIQITEFWGRTMECKKLARSKFKNTFFHIQKYYVYLILF